MLGEPGPQSLAQGAWASNKQDLRGPAAYPRGGPGCFFSILQAGWGGDRGVGRGGERARAGVYGLVIYYTLYRMDPHFFLVFFLLFQWISWIL